MFINRHVVCLFALVLAVTSCGNKGKEITLVNTLSIDRPDALIVLKRADVVKKLGSLGTNQYIRVTTTDNKQLPVQFDDLDRDGVWDEMVFQYTFGPEEKTKVYLSATDKKSDAGTARAHVRLRKKTAAGNYGPMLVHDTMPYRLPANDFNKVPIPYYQTEGPAWENDKVAFRLYFDVRNAKDLFGKTTGKMMMDTVGVEGDIHYHKRADWGMDILKVGKSLGAGSIAIQTPYNGKDTLVRLGGDSLLQATYERIADGPVRAILKMHYDVKFPGATAPSGITEEISIWGGQYFYESHVSATGLPAGTQLVTGIVNLHSKKAVTTNTAGCDMEYTYDVQSENNDKLGMGILVPDSYFDKFGASTNDSLADIQHTYTVTEKPSGNDLGTFRFYFGWEPTNKMFTSEEGFAAYLKQECMRYGKDVQIIW